MNQDRETYVRQSSLGLEVPKAVAVVGCGGVGSWTAYLLAMAGVENIWLWDHDTLSEHNRGRMPVAAESWNPETGAMYSNIGKPKTEVVARLIKSVRPNCKVLAMGMFTAEVAETVGLGKEVSWIIATTDTWSSRQEIKAWADENSIKYLEASAEGEFGGVTGEPADFATERETERGYASVPVWVGSSVMAATLVAYHVLHGGELGDASVRIGWQDGGLDVQVPETLPEEPELCDNCGLSEELHTPQNGVEHEYTHVDEPAPASIEMTEREG